MKITVLLPEAGSSDDFCMWLCAWGECGRLTSGWRSSSSWWPAAVAPWGSPGRSPAAQHRRCGGWRGWTHSPSCPSTPVGLWSWQSPVGDMAFSSWRGTGDNASPPRRLFLLTHSSLPGLPGPYPVAVPHHHLPQGSGLSPVLPSWSDLPTTLWVPWGQGCLWLSPSTRAHPTLIGKERKIQESKSDANWKRKRTLSLSLSPTC